MSILFATGKITTATATATAVLPVVVGQKRPLSEEGPETKKMKLSQGN